MTPEDLRNLSPEEQLYGAVYLAATFGPHLYQLAPIVASIKPADRRRCVDCPGKGIPQDASRGVGRNTGWRVSGLQRLGLPHQNGNTCTEGSIFPSIKEMDSIRR